GARRFELPDWVQGPVARARDEAARRLADHTAEAERLRGALREAETRHEVPAALGDMIRIDWVAGEMEKLPVTENLGWITGWTSAREEEALRTPLERLDLPHAFRFAEPPPERTPPSILLNPPWARPFELFARLLGTPAVQEADPSIFLSVIAPLLFGYMFGDVGHGAVLLVAGLVLRARFPLTGLLVPGGAAAIGFGFLFGEIFGMHVLPALWLRPMEEPLTLLFTPLAGGGVIIALGLLLDGLTAIWRRRFGRWLLRDFGLVVAYGGLWGLLADPRSAWVAALGVLWYVAGHLTDRFRSPFAALMQGAGALIENALRLLVNTISFVRVGAFALAHAGLGIAVANLAGAAGPGGQWPVLILGNLFIIVIEGLVVSVQTTRLILFEFFIRFLQATGRPFRPSLPPEWAGTKLQATRGEAA
ncbi:MAG: V-type ATPase 116kDa subunit family protein, partial [Alphaproteobacteria bacterium]